MRTLTVWVDDLTIPPRLRQADAATVDALAESMSAIGLQQPISIYTEEDPGGGPSDAILVAGLHRLRAAQKLGWEKIEAFAVDLSETDRERWEISENLHRSELSSLQRSNHIARWIELSRLGPERAEKLADPKLAQSAPVYSGGRGHKGGIREAARQLNISRDDAQRSVKIASLSPEAKDAARETGLDDNQSALLQAAREETPDQQVASLQERAQGKATNNGLPYRRESKSDATAPPSRNEKLANLRESKRLMELERDQWMSKAGSLEKRVRSLKADLSKANAEIDALKAALADRGEGGAA